MKSDEIHTLIFIIVVMVLGLTCIGFIIGSGWQQHEDNKRLNKLGYRLVYHHYRYDNVSTNWYELTEIKENEK